MGNFMSGSEGILDRLLSAPLRNHIKIDFDIQNKYYILSVPIFASRAPLPSSIFSYVDARKNHEFKPHATTFQIEKAALFEKVLIVQRVPFSSFTYPALRQHVDHFLKMARKCRSMLSEIAFEEKLGDALSLSFES